MTEADKKERRAWVRIPSTPETPFSGVSEADCIIAQKARIRDLSVAGVGLLVAMEIEPDMLVDVVLLNTAEDSARPFQARVVRSQPQPDGGWILGCSFTTPLSEEELRDYL